MGLIRDAIGSALGGNQPNNGLSGGLVSKLSAGSMNRAGNSRANLSSDWGRSSPRGRGYYDSSRDDEEQSYSLDERGYSGGRDQQYTQMDGVLDTSEQYPNRGYPRSMDRALARSVRSIYANNGDLLEPPPRYESPPREERSWSQRGACSAQQQYDATYFQSERYNPRVQFRPVALPQMSYGDGQPFIRGYCCELSRYNISMADFIQVVDSINVVITPSPENQIFQKGAKIAGWFLPGAASIGLAVGQVGVGLGAAAGNASQLSSVLFSANINLFLPNGLELCIGKSTDVDAVVGIAPGSAQLGVFNPFPAQRQAAYGDLLAPISTILPPLQQYGRTDPVAMLGKGLSNRDSKKRLAKAQRKMEKGQTGNSDGTEGGFKWIIVRQATADALTYRENYLRQGNTSGRYNS